MKVSIITVCFNSSACIEDAILSVVRQSYKKIEYIIIDGKSTDGTLDVINKYRNVISKVISEKDKGIYDAINTGIRIATGDIIYFLNSDDTFYDENVVSEVVCEFNPDVDLIIGRVDLLDVPCDILPYLKQPQIKRKKDLLSQGIYHQAVFSKRSLFEKLGLFNTNYKVYADHDWFLSAFSNKGIKIKFIDRPIANYYFQGFSFQNRDKLRKEKTHIIYKHFSLPIFIFYIIRYIVLKDLKSKFKILKKNLVRRGRNQSA